MMTISRRELLTTTAAGLALATMPTAAAPAGGRKTMGVMLNTSTIRGQALGIVKEVEIAGKAGYDAIEPWMNELRKYVEEGGALADLKKRIEDQHLTVESAIGFANWIVDDPALRVKGLEEARKDMEMVRAIGGKRLAAPPAGATKQKVDPLAAGERYRKLLELGEQMGIVPQLELWGFSASLSKLSETAQVLAEAGHPQACLLADIYHIHKGGSDFASLNAFAGSGMHVFHINDYPKVPPRESITDADRIYPGDGVAPTLETLRNLHMRGFRGMLSVELFNREYWKQDAFDVAQTALTKARALVAQATN